MTLFISEKDAGLVLQHRQLRHRDDVFGQQRHRKNGSNRVLVVPAGHNVCPSGCRHHLLLCLRHSCPVAKYKGP